jgi:Cu/Ag efflux pump CusA
VVPIVMTALCAALALVPIVLAGDAPGHEIEQPMAIVILGGLVTSTALNLLLLPTLVLRFGGGSQPILDRDPRRVSERRGLST